MESAETVARLSQLRDKCERGERLTDEEEKEVVALVRADRRNASLISAKSKAKAPANPAAVLDKINAILGKKSG